jgi:hypothetical protein
MTTLPGRNFKENHWHVTTTSCSTYTKALICFLFHTRNLEGLKSSTPFVPLILPRSPIPYLSPISRTVRVRVSFFFFYN